MSDLSDHTPTIRRLVAERRARGRHFPAGLFGEPAWDLLLDCALARVSDRPLSITAACIGSGVAATTALRHIALLVETGFIERIPDDTDRRRTWLELSTEAEAMMAGYLQKVTLP